MLSLCIPPLHGEADACYYDYVYGLLEPKTWYDYRFGQMAVKNYNPMVWWLDKNKENWIEGLQVAKSFPKRKWFLGNEPERNRVSPKRAIAAALEWIEKSGCENWAFSGVNISIHHADNGYDWLNSYLDENGPLPPAWHIHAYGNGKDLEAAVDEFGMWMVHRGVKRPVYLTEFASTEHPFETMVKAEELIQKGKIKEAYWFSAYWNNWVDPSCLTEDGCLTEIGNMFLGGEELFLPLTLAS